jgi:adenylate kinase
MQNYILLGMPGSGKGTMGKKLIEEFEFIHLSTGDLIRAEQANKTKIGLLADRMSDQGQFLPDQIIIQMFQQFVKDNPTDIGYVFDGYPRTKEQAKHLHAFMLKSRLPLTSVVYLEIEKLDAVNRLLKRADIEGRKDDTKPVIEKRIEIYKSKTFPLIKFFDDMKKLVRVDGGGEIEEQYDRLKKAMEI